MTMTDPMPSSVRETLIRSANEAAPREICGFILPDWKIVFMTNVAEGERQFRVDNQELLDFYVQFPNPLGFFHSHPSGRQSPSDTDHAYAPQGMRYWIVTPDGVYGWDMDHDSPVVIA